MNEADGERDPLEILAAEFIERQRRGELPSVAEYAQRHPDMAEEIEELFPTIAVMEQVKAIKEKESGSQTSLGRVRLERLGDFRILGEIGRGGMGIVYEAVQESLGRHVAVKILPRQTLLDPQQLRRFQREAQTAARLHHTNIVPVFGVGEHDGFHFIVMQLIEGAGLDVVLDKLRQAGSPTPVAAQSQDSTRVRPGAAAPSRCREGSDVASLVKALAEGRFGQPQEFTVTEPDRLDDTGPTQEKPIGAGRSASPATEEFAFNSDKHANGDTPPADATALGPGPARADPWQIGPPYWRSVAAIGQQLAEALQYAHAHHTLHRDIKPANLLLDTQGVVWITDFGLAKAMEHDNVTQTGAMVGTLRYMAPEQFSGQADHRSDVYSLGLTLYELLTLRPAFAGKTRNSLIAQIAHGEPPSPRKLNPAIPRDLETIVLKAMAREPRDRYASAGDLARDLECFLEDRPIYARRASAAERVWRWARRNRAVASLIACSLALLAAVAVVASVGYIRISRANAQAEDTSALAVDALDSIFRQFAPDRTAPVSASLRVSDAEDPVSVPVQPVLSKEAAVFLEHMLKFYDRLADQGGDDARLHRKVAEANRRVGDIRQRLGHFPESKAAYLRAIELYTRLAESSTKESDLPTEIARIQNELGNVYEKLNDPEAGRKSHQSALATLHAAAAESSASPDCQYELARTYFYLGKHFGGPSGPPPPEPRGRREPRWDPIGFVFDPRGPKHGPRAPFPLAPAQRVRNDWTRRSPSGNGSSTTTPRGRPAPGFPHEHHREQVPGPPGPRPMLAGDDRNESQQYREKAVELLERLVADHPTVPAYRHLLARCYRETPPFCAGRAANSEPDGLTKATQILEDLVKEFPDVADYRYDLSETYAMSCDQWRRGPEAPGKNAAQRSSAMLEKALALSEQLVAEHPNIPEYAMSLVNIRLRLSLSLGETDATRAESNLRSALDVQSVLVRRFPENSSYKFWMAVIQESLGGFYLAHDQLPEAKSALQGSIDSFKEALQHDARPWIVRGFLAKNYMNLAGVLRRMGDDTAADYAIGQAESVRREE